MQSNSDFPEEIIVNIISRLPAKSVGKCRCVSKSWRTVFSQPQFITTHLHLTKTLNHKSLFLISQHSEPHKCLSYASLKNARHLFDEITIRAKWVSFPHLPKRLSRVYGSCDGLLLIGNWGHDLFVLNPITKEIKKVPQSPFILNPNERYIAHGFGYDSVSDDYKIVTVSYEPHNDYDEEYDEDYDGGYDGEDHDASEILVDVYSLKSGTWKKVESSLYNLFSMQFTSGACVDGCIYWLTRRNAIVGFDLAQEKFHEIPSLRSSVIMDYSCGRFFPDRFSCLAVFDDGHLWTWNLKDNVWVMEEHSESFAKLTIYDHDAEDEMYVPNFEPLSVSGQGEVVLKNSEKLVVYNLEERTLMDIDIRGIRYTLLDAAIFVESLVSPYGNSQAGRE